MKVENNNLLLEEYKKRFSQIVEYTIPSNTVLAEDDEELPQENGDDEAEIPMGDDNMQMNGNEQPQGLEVDNEQGEQMPQGNNGFGGDVPSEDLTGGFSPDDAQMGDMSAETMQPEDEVVDITELTDAQEETREDIEQFSDTFKKAFKVISSLEDMVNNTSAKIDNLEKELKRRNPTQMEKMSNRASLSYPFNVSPEEYWDEKEKNSNYSTEYDNNGENDEEYTITVNDINSAKDWKNISDSMDDDLLYNQTLNKILNF